MVEKYSKLNYYSNKVKMKERPTVKDILLILGLGAVVVGSIAMPGLPRVLYFLTKKDKKEQEKLARFDHGMLTQELKRLAKRGMVKFEEINSKTIVKLTEVGVSKVKKYELENLKIKRPKKWDGKWRLVIFDIPDKKKMARELFRKNLKRLGFYQLQKSVFIHAFPCFEEVVILREQYNLTSREVLVMIVDDLEGEQISLKSFT